MAIERISLPGEVWKPVLGYEESYEVSNLGRVWSIPIGKGEHGTGRILAAHPDKKGYPRCSLKGKTFKVHHLVLNAFVGERSSGHECGHLDGNPSNPALTNLEWITSKENKRHMKLHGTQPMGFDCRLTVLTPEKVREIRALRNGGAMWKDVAAQACVTRTTAINAGTGRYFADFEPETICRTDPAKAQPHRRNRVAKAQGMPGIVCPAAQ